MAKPRTGSGVGDLGARLTEVAAILDRAVAVLADTLTEIREKEISDDIYGPGGGTDAAADDGDSQ
jgi:hypothetical protein